MKRKIQKKNPLPQGRLGVNDCLRRDEKKIPSPDGKRAKEIMTNPPL